MFSGRALLPFCLLGLFVSSFGTPLKHRAQQKVVEDRQVYVIGRVITPMAIPLEQSMTVSQTISMAGGPPKDGKSDKVSVKIYRSLDRENFSTCVSLKQIKKDQALDLQLQTNDILDVERGQCSRPLCWQILPKVERQLIQIIK